ncbi:MAG: hypothetical protein AUJ23_00075 [Candidatus Magasanikbacteria bacterium CG1_02_32_51]|uniref:Uncharacterized protein n=1 Tax=Candidatus Magasanikbacteria bacterium CG1_02_32_51 TaxID=1805238 RepID=A0A1J4UEA4_9BACT|nr:MAG: hypothetical protein AUJ23_00075 [Candidatus Magasanikbacteria bacterium CG1_02_32_51]
MIKESNVEPSFHVLLGEKKELKEEVENNLEQIKEVFSNYIEKIIIPIIGYNIEGLIYNDKNTKLIIKKNKFSDNQDKIIMYDVGEAIKVAVESKKKLQKLFQTLFDSFLIDTKVENIITDDNLIKKNGEEIGKLFLGKNLEQENNLDNFSSISALAKLNQELPKIHMASRVYEIFTKLQEIEKSLENLKSIVSEQKVQNGVQPYNDRDFNRIPIIYKRFIKVSLSNLFKMIEDYFAD